MKTAILVVDDDAALRRIIQYKLAQHGYAVSVAVDGDEAVALLRGTRFDLVLSDMKMPGLTGIELLEQAKKIQPEIAVILMTAFAAIPQAVLAIKLGAFDYLTKPFSVSELELRISNLISQREQLRLKYSHDLIVDPKDTALANIDQQFLENTHNSIKENMKNVSFGVEQLAENMNLSASQLHRKLEALIDHTPGQLIRHMRLQKAAELISQNAGNLAEICFLTGFNDQTYFSRAFKQQFGCSPSSYKKKSH